MNNDEQHPEVEGIWFLCPFCNEIKDWHSQMVIIGSAPENADGQIMGMHYQECGYCYDCLNGSE